MIDRRAALSLVLLACIPSTPTLAPAGEPTVTLKGDGVDHRAVPVVVPVGESIATGDYLLESNDGGQPLRANVFEDAGGRFLGLMVDQLGAAQVRTFRMIAAGSTTSPFAVSINPVGDAAEVQVGGKPFTRLVLGDRKPYLHPVLGPTGAPFTRAYPMEDVEGEDKDHPHQRSFWFTHGDVNGYDFWAADPKNGPNPKFGTIRQDERATAAGGLAVGRLRTRDTWIGGGEPLCTDERVLTFSAAEGRRILDVDVIIRAGDSPVTFGDTKEGSFGLRVASSMDAKRKPGGKIVNAEGIEDAKAWGKPSPWVDYSGPVAGETVGVAILNHPESFRYPTTWHVRDYGLFAANPFGYHDFGLKAPGAHTIPAGGSIRFRYRVILHEEGADAAGMASAFRSYAHPPTVGVSSD